MRNLDSPAGTYRRKLVVLASMGMILSAVTHLPVRADPGEQAPWNAAHGLVSSMKVLWDYRDGEPERLERYEESTYDNRGNRTLFVEHRLIHGRWRVETTTSTFDRASNLVHEVVDRGSQVVERWLDYDDRGILVEERTETYNRGELTYVDVKIYRYDRQGNLVEEIHDRSGAYPFLRRWTLAYDERGALVEEIVERDNGKDGLDSWWRSSFAYNERGDLVEKVWERGDDDTGATSEYSSFRFSYDSNGKLQEQRRQFFDADSQLVREELWEYTHEPTGSQVIERIVVTNFPAAGPPTVTFERSITWRYDPRGNVVEVLSEEDLQDGRCYQLLRTRQLDPQGRPLEEIFAITSLGCDDGEARHTSSTTTTFSYDRWGNLIQETSEYERDGIPRSIYTMTYEY